MEDNQMSPGQRNQRTNNEKLPRTGSHLWWTAISTSATKYKKPY